MMKRSVFRLFVVALTCVLAFSCGSENEKQEQTPGAVRAALTNNERILNFEGAIGGAGADWIAGAGTTASASSTSFQGLQALALSGSQNPSAISAPLSSLGSIASKATLEVGLPASLQGQGWFGQMALFFNAPSRGIHNQYAGPTSLSGPLGQFRHYEISLPQNVVTALSGATFNDLTVTVQLNVPSTNGAFLIDKLVLAESSSDGGTGGAGAADAAGGSAGTSSGGTAGTGGSGATAGSVGSSGSGGAGGETVGPCNFTQPPAGGSSQSVDFVISLPRAVERQQVAIGTAGGFLALNDRVDVVDPAGHFVAVSSVGATSRTNVGTDVDVGTVYSEPAGVDLRARAHIHGDVQTAAEVSRQTDTVVDGSVIENTSLQLLETVSWRVSFPSSTRGSCSLEPDQTQQIPPASYGDIVIKSRSRLKVRSGSYTFSSLSFEPQAVLEIDNGSGPVFLYVRNSFGFSGTVTETQSNRANVLLGVAGSVNIQSSLRAILVAPWADVTLPTTGSIGHTGSWFSKSLTVHQSTILHHRPFSPLEFCAPDASCSAFCPCSGGAGTCGSDADCQAGLVCPSVPNGPRHGRARGARVCEPPVCTLRPDIAPCGAAGAACGSCENVVVCQADSDCPAGEVCGFGQGAAFGASSPDVCVPPGCLTDPVATGCGHPTGSLCGKCPCAPSCENKQCGDDPFDGCSGQCPGLCVTRQAGCRSDTDCPAGNACILGGGPRIGLAAGTNVCLPSACVAPGRQACGSISSTCGLCPALPADVCDGIECGDHPIHGVPCGSPTCGSGLVCDQGHCVPEFTEDVLKLEVASRSEGGAPFTVAPLSPPDFRPDTVPGATAGRFGVSSRGTATYAIDIIVPPGRSDMEPDISLNYTGGGPNGPAGIGWSLGGFSSITRCPRIGADGWTKPVEYIPDDRLCLDGHRLVIVEGTYGTTGATYRTEVDRLDRVVQLRDDSDEHAFFRVFKKDGRIFTYGRTRDSQLFRDRERNLIRAWALSSVRDRVGNFIGYEYAKLEDPEPRISDDAGHQTVEFLPSVITYGGVSNELGSLRGNRTVSFHYSDADEEARPDYMDGYTRGGARIARSHFLKRIDTRVGGTLVRSYDLAYVSAPLGAPHPHRGILRLDHITECGHKYGEAVCKRPTTFAYTDDRGFDPARPPQITGLKPLSDVEGKVWPAPLIVLDWDGDGRDDILTHEPLDRHTYRWKILFTRGATAGLPFGQLALSSIHPRSQSPCFSQQSVLDYDLDGKDDLFDFCTGQVLHGDSLRRTSTNAPLGGGGANRHSLVDFDGDGDKDLFTCFGDGTAGFARFGTLLTGRGFGTLQGVISGWGRCDNEEEPFFVVDIDGDGFEDLVKVKTEVRGQALVGDLARYVTDPVQPARWQLLAAGADKSSKFIDVNGDGLRDVLDVFGRIHINAGGSRFIAPVPAYGPYAASTFADLRFTLSIDYNGDGFEDLLRPTPSTGLWHFDRALVADFGQALANPVLVPDLDSNNPQLLVQPGVLPPFWQKEFGQTAERRPIRALADVDGDGSRDLLQISDAGNLVIQYGLFGRENLLARVTDGLGKRIDIEYDVEQTSGGTTRRTYTPSASCAQPPSGLVTRCLSGLAHGVGRLVSSYVIGSETSQGVFFRDRRYRLFYEGAREGLFGRGWLSFAKRTVEETRPSSVIPIQTTQIFEDNYALDATRAFPFAGLETKRVVSSAFDKSEIEKELTKREVTTVNVWNTAPSALGGRFPFRELSLEGVEDVNVQGTRFAVLGTITATEVDDLANVTFENTQTLLNSISLAVSTSRTIIDRARVNGPSCLTPNPNECGWLINLPRRRSVSESVLRDEGPTPTRTRTTEFGFNNFGLLESIVRQPDEPIDSSERQEILYLRNPDIFHSLKRIRVTGRWKDAQERVFNGSRVTELEYDQDKIFPEHVKRLVGIGLAPAPDRFLVTDVKYDPRDGTLLSRVDPTGMGEQWSYDEFGRVASFKSPAETVSVDYQDAASDFSQIIAVNPRMQIQTRSSTGASSTSRIDGLGRLVQTETTGLQGQLVLQETFYVLGDQIGLQSRPHLFGDRTQGIITNEHDARHRLTRRVFPDGNDVQFLYASPMTVAPGQLPPDVSPPPARTVLISGVEDGRNHRTFTLNDFRNQPLRSIDALSTITAYDYEPFGILAEVTDARENVTRMVPDGLGRIIEHFDADSGTKNYRYTAFDESFTHTDDVQIPDAGGTVRRTTTYTYDLVGRLTSIGSPDGITSFAYDGPGPNAMGRLVETQSADQHTEHYNYEPPPTDGDPTKNRGFVSSIDRVITGSTFTTKFRYNSRSLLEGVEYPPSPAPVGPGGTTIENAPFIVDYEYDIFGNLQAATEHNAEPGGAARDYWRLVEPSQGYRIGKESFGNGITTSYGYEALTGRLSSLETTAPGSTVLQRIDYSTAAGQTGYDANGNLTARRQTFKKIGEPGTETSTEGFTYDALDRVTHHGAQLPTGAATTLEELIYSAIGNINAKLTTGSYVYSAPGEPTRPHAVHTVTTNSGARTDYRYDAAGNMTRRSGAGIEGGTQETLYTAFNLPKLIKLGDNGAAGEIRYEYDAQQRRVVLTHNKLGGTETRLYVGGAYERQTTTDAAGPVTRHLYKVFAASKQVTQVEREVRSGVAVEARRFLHQDHLGSSQLITDEAGILLHRQEFDIFGKARSPTKDSTERGVAQIRAGFTGHESDYETGLVNMRGRIYDPNLGRFMQADPPLMQSPFWSQGLNRYSYVFNNPLNAIDPSGFDLEEDLRVIEGETPEDPDDRAWEELSVDEMIEVILAPADAAASYAEARAEGKVESMAFQKALEEALATGNREALAAILTNAEVRGDIVPPPPHWQSSSQATSQASSVAEPHATSAAGIERRGDEGAQAAPDPEQGGYRNLIAREQAAAGRTDYAQIAEAGFGCSYCHLQFGLGRAPENNELNLQRYAEVQLPLNFATFGLGVVGSIASAAESVALLRASRPTYQITDRSSARTPVGRQGQRVNFPNPSAPQPRNAPGVVNGREYAGHAFDRMQERGFTPTVVENAIQHGEAVPGAMPGTLQHFDDVNNFSVITEAATGRVITVF